MYCSSGIQQASNMHKQLTSPCRWRSTTCRGDVLIQGVWLRWETGFMGSCTWQKLRCWSFMMMLSFDLMHTLGGELKRLFLMVLGARMSLSIAEVEMLLGRCVMLNDQALL